MEFYLPTLKDFSGSNSNVLNVLDLIVSRLARFDFYRCFADFLVFLADLWVLRPNFIDFENL